MFEKKYKILFLRKEFSTLNLVKIMQTNSISNIMNIYNKSYHIEIDKPAFSEKKTKVYILDIDLGTQLSYFEISKMLNPNEIDLLFSHQIVKELTAGAISDKKEKLINMILGVIIGALFSALLMFFYMQNKIEEIYASLPIQTTIIP